MQKFKERLAKIKEAHARNQAQVIESRPAASVQDQYEYNKRVMEM